MNNCLFCKIIKGEIPSEKIYEDENVYAFLDIAPVNPGHTLVIPKKHFETMTEMTDDILSEVIVATNKISKAIMKGMDVKGFNIGLNNGKVAGQLVPHVHFHIMPRKENDNLKLWPQRKYEDGEAGEVAEKIRLGLDN